MLGIHLDIIGDMAVVECDGKIVRNQAALRLRDVVTAQIQSSIVVLDLSEVEAIEGDGLSMLVFLQRWAHDLNIRLKLFNPCRSVKHALENASSIYEFDIPTLHQTMALLVQAENRYAVAA